MRLLFREAFSRQNVVGNVTAAALTAVVTPLIHLYAGLSWPYLIPVAVGVAALFSLVIYALWRSIHAEPSPAVTPRRVGGVARDRSTINIIRPKGMGNLDAGIETHDDAEGNIEDADFN